MHLYILQLFLRDFSNSFAFMKLVGSGLTDAFSINSSSVSEFKDIPSWIRYIHHQRDTVFSLMDQDSDEEGEIDIAPLEDLPKRPSLITWNSSQRQKKVFHKMELPDKLTLSVFRNQISTPEFSSWTKEWATMMSETH